jgi:hypothetical protein
MKNIFYLQTKCRNITFEIVKKYPDKPWNWDYLSCNPNITMDIVETYPDKPWNWACLSEHLFELSLYNL